jgi:hypothetical protein
VAGTRDPELTTDGAARLAADHPALAVFARACATEPAGRPGRAARARARLAALDARVDGARAAVADATPVPCAYRVLARQVGLDPDADGLPLDLLLRERIRRGRFVLPGPVAGACAAALLETGVPVWALDAAMVDGPLHVRADGRGALAVVDLHRVVAPLLAEPSVDVAARDDCPRVVLYALRCAGVADVTVREALSIAVDVLSP